ncbi:D-Ala-D-Ala carboxypeptidase family metallohydrolase [Pseudoxanthomonas sp. LjRoot143]|uniref:D-Ala-D-Ala carboxypeptidase family metallohydrolase n=1 Tax=Pseudoxanthomonas sp. LjRoot143 TaxID=3342266 RepID=UPI003ECFE350
MRRLLLLLIVLSTTACAPLLPDATQRYEAWRRSSDAEALDDYERMLARAGVGGVVPMSALLRSNRRWRMCGPEFLLPPREHAGGIVPTLRLVAQLERMGIVEGGNVRSGYRSAEVNQCAGGSTRSRHLRNNALDFDLADDTRTEVLCDFWRKQGPSLHMGLGFYTPTRIHIDTAGHRTWGTDYRRGTSLCVRPQDRTGSPASGRLP